MTYCFDLTISHGRRANVVKHVLLGGIFAASSWDGDYGVQKWGGEFPWIPHWLWRK